MGVFDEIIKSNKYNFFIGAIVIIVIIILIIQFVEGIIRHILVLLIVLYVAYYFIKKWFGIDIFIKLTGKNTSIPKLDIIINKKESDKPQPVQKIDKSQVFNIPENTFEYNDARALCSAYGSRLATYSEIENSYNNGGSWCNYGWSEGQMALYPTQKKVYDELQKKTGHEHDCGRPGINGGYMANSSLKFGVNCFGIKPPMSDTSKLWMETQPTVPKTKEEETAESKAKYWQQTIKELLISPFNHSNWSRY